MKRIMNYEDKLLGKVEIPSGWEKSIKFVRSDGSVIAKRRQPLTPEQERERQALLEARDEAKRKALSKRGAKWGVGPIKSGESPREYISRIAVARSEKMLKDALAKKKALQKKIEAEISSIEKQI